MERSKSSFQSKYHDAECQLPIKTQALEYVSEVLSAQDALPTVDSFDQSVQDGFEGSSHLDGLASIKRDDTTTDSIVGRRRWIALLTA